MIWGCSVIIYSVRRLTAPSQRRSSNSTPMHRVQRESPPSHQRHEPMTRCRRPIRIVEPVSGWCRIRTCGTSRFTCFQDRRVRPLRQPSMPDFLSGRSGYGPHVHDWHPMSGTPRCVERSGERAGFYRQRRGQRCLSYAPSGRAVRSVTNRAGSSPARALPHRSEGVFGHSHDDG